MSVALNLGLRPHRSEVRGQDPLVPFQLRTIRVGTQTTLVALLASAAFFTLSAEGHIKFGPYFALFVSVTIAAALVTLLPWKRPFETGLVLSTQYAWTAVNILLITLGIWVTGQGRSFLFLLYALPTVFSAVSFRPKVQLYFLCFTFGCYSTVMGLMGWDVMSLAVLGVLAFLASFLSGELKHQMGLHSEARRESERRWDLVAAVAAAARNMSTVDSRDVLQSVVDAVGALGFDTACMFVRDGTNGPFRALFPVGLSRELPRTPYSLPQVVRTALEEGRAVVDKGGPAQGVGDRWLEAVGLRAAAAVPVPVEEGTEAVLFVGSKDPAGPSAQDLEVFRMLAAQASVALENARRFEEQSRDMERMAELDRLKGDFLSNVSHELRTPLTVIRGMGLTLEQQWSDLDEDTRSDLLSRLNANASSLNDIITKLLDFSRVEAGRLEAHAQEIDVRHLLAEVTDRLMIMFMEHDLVVGVDEGLIVEADPVLLERIVENLLSNAAKHTPAGSRIELTARRDGDQAVVQVSDDGPGIPADELKHLGERFFRGGDPNTRNTRGTGLGLALVREILALHDGRLEVESTVGVGSRFTFRLPLAGPDVSEERRNRTERSGAKGQTPPGSPYGGPSGRGNPPRERFETVLTAARLGAEWAVAALHGDLNPRVEGYLRAQAPSAAQSLAADVWMEVGSGLGEFEGDEAGFRRWVFTVARRRLRDLGRGTDDDRSTIVAIESADEDRRESEETREALARIAELPADIAEVMLLRVVGDLSTEEVAAITGRRPGAVRVLQHQGIDRLTEQVKERLSLLDEVGSGNVR
jgi:RNA polymerase sigma factor (sigma-70 family)